MGSQQLRGHILFDRAGGKYGEGTLYVAHADGTHQRRLTRFGDDSGARMSRDGKQILRAASAPDGRITTATEKSDGSGYRKLPLPSGTINLGPGAWSPDGHSIAFQGWDDSNPARNGMYIGRASNGGDLRRVTTAKTGQDLPGDFSPDGRQIAFFRERPDFQSVGSVWVVNVNGTGLRRLTPTGFLAGFGNVRWSPDGRTILLQTARNQPEGALWTVNPDGSHFTKLFKDRRGRFASAAVWSPDGRQIMFSLDPTADQFSHPPNGVYVINADATGLRRVIGGRNCKGPSDWVS
jgi:Tol biopolymer transport system component